MRSRQPTAAAPPATRWWASRPAAVAGAVLVATALGLTVAWLAWPAAHEGVRLHADARAFPWQRTPQSVEGAELAAAGPASGPAAAAEAASSAAAAGPTAVDLCGVGRVTVGSAAAAGGATGGVLGGTAAGAVVGAMGGASAAGAARPLAPPRDHQPLAELPAPMGRFPLEEAQARIVGHLAGGTARQRVASRLLQEPAEGNPAAVAAWAEGLVAEALASGDAQALRWAGAACSQAGDEATCRKRLARARTQVEPANALHWLEWAAAEPEAADAAWAGLNRATYWREHTLGLAGVLLGAVPTDIPGYLQATLGVEAMSRDVSFAGPPLTLALDRCPAATNAGGARGAGAAATCERLARLLLERGDSVQALMLARELGEHIGWPAAQLQRLDAEVDALQKQEHHWAVDPSRPLGCDTVESQRKHIAAVEREGELAVLRRNVAEAMASASVLPRAAAPVTQPPGGSRP